MRSNDIYSLPMVLRELSLLRALGTSLRTSSYRHARPSRAALPLSRPPQPPDAFAALPRDGVPTADFTPDKRP